MASLEHDARQPRLAMEADGQADTKTRQRTEGAANKAVQAMHGDSVSTNRVDSDPMYATTFGVKVEPPALPCRDNVLAENGAAAPKSCLSYLEMRSPTAAGGLLPAGMATTATRTTFHQLPLWFCLAEETSSRTSFLYVSYFSSFGWTNNQQVPSWPRVVETKSRQDLVFYIGGSTGRLRACPLFGNVARVALWGDSRFGAAGSDLQRVLEEG